MRRASLVFLALVSSTASAFAQDLPPSIHQRELAAHEGEPPAARTMPPPPRLARPRALDRVVYGYYPYWVSGLDTIRWSTLTHLAWFALEMDSTGAVTAHHGWPDATTVAAAHAANVRVDLTFTLFSGTGIRTLCTDATRRATAIANMIDELEAGGADGISVDFEGLIDGTRDAFTTFITELRAGLDARGHADAEISIAGPSVNWAGSDGVPEFDLPALLAQADYYFIMGYGYFWSGSSHAGGIGILRLSALWRQVQSWSMERTVADFASDVGAAHRHQIIHGVPYYGQEWITADDQPASAASSSVGAVTYANARGDLAAGQTRRWDADSRQPWYAWQSGSAWHQVWYDDEESLAEKYRFAVEQDLGGIGIWALNYDAGYSELWDQLEASLGPEEVVPGDRRDPLPIDAAAFHDERSTADAPGDYFDYYACAPTTPEYGREWVYRLDLCAPTHLDAVVDVDPGADVDLQLLTAPDEAACVARDDTTLSVDLDPGVYYLVADTFVSNLVTAEGGYRLDVTLSAGDGAICVAAPDAGPDAGDGGGGEDAGCCSTGGGGASTGGLALALALALARRRRPGTMTDP